MGNITIQPKYINFAQKIKDLHTEMCNEIAFLLKATDTRELDLLGTDASHTTVFYYDKYENTTTEVEVKKVTLDESGEVFVTTLDDSGYSEEVYIQFIESSSARNLYETVFEKLVVKNKKSHG